jgi:5-formyltetrahydrofolate cyclo-ligase
MPVMPPFAEPGIALREAKRLLRRDTLARRDALPAHVRSVSSDAIAARIAAMPSFVRAHTVLLTLAFRSEWDTRTLVRAAFAAGKIVALPRVDDARRALELHTVVDALADVVHGFRGIPEPRADAPSIDARDVGWVLVPGVAFDAEGRRLGYGAGYYDRLLPLLPRDTPRVAGAFDAQIVERVPAAEQDANVDVIVTETRVIEVPRQ